MIHKPPRGGGGFSMWTQVCRDTIRDMQIMDYSYTVNTEIRDDFLCCPVAAARMRCWRIHWLTRDVSIFADSKKKKKNFIKWVFRTQQINLDYVSKAKWVLTNFHRRKFRRHLLLYSTNNDNKSFTPTELKCRRQQTLHGKKVTTYTFCFCDISLDSEEVYDALWDGLGMCQDTDH